MSSYRLSHAAKKKVQEAPLVNESDLSAEADGGPVRLQTLVEKR